VPGRIPGAFRPPASALLGADAALVRSVREERRDTRGGVHLGERRQGRADDGRQRDTVDIGQTPGRKAGDSLPGE